MRRHLFCYRRGAFVQEYGRDAEQMRHVAFATAVGIGFERLAYFRDGLSATHAAVAVHDDDHVFPSVNEGGDGLPDHSDVLSQGIFNWFCRHRREINRGNLIPFSLQCRSNAGKVNGCVPGTGNDDNSGFG